MTEQPTPAEILSAIVQVVEWVVTLPESELRLIETDVDGYIRERSAGDVPPRTLRAAGLILYALAAMRLNRIEAERQA